MILVVGKENCDICESTKQKLNELGIKYEYKLLNELENKKHYIQVAKEYGQMAMPILFNNNEYTTLQEIIDKHTLKITKRNGELANFDKQRIINAVNNAMFETGEIDNNLSEKIAYEIETEISSFTKVEDIQDIIINKLEKYKRNDIAKRYSKYRNKKTKEREVKQTIIPQKLLSDEFLSQYKHIKPSFTPLGEFVYYRTYSRWIPELKRREYWWETVQRIVEYNCSLLPTSIQEAEELYDNIFNLRQFPSGRSLWIAGTKSALEYPLSNFNCSFVVIDDFIKFSELFHALLVGAGVGFRVLFDDVNKLPTPRFDIEIIHKPYKSIRKRYRDENTSLHIKQKNAIIEVGDSKSGWIKALTFYFNILTDKDYKEINTITFDYDNVRPFGEKLETFGGFASGHESVKNMFVKIDSVIKTRNEKLRPIDCIDISNIIAENVIVGGVRRSAEIGLIDPKDEESIKAKNNLYTEVKKDVWVENKEILHRRMSNNTIVYFEKPTREQLHWNLEQMRYSGEPAFMNMKEALRRNPNAKGLNPCAEIILDDRGTCNLSVVNLMAFVNEDGTYNKEDLYKAQRLSSRLAYRMTCVELEMNDWAETQNRDRLLGCDLTGDQDFINATKMTKAEWDILTSELKAVAREEMKNIAKENNLNESLLVTAGKPNGTLALLPTVSAGIHFSHSPYYIRRVRISTTDPLCKVVEELGYPIFPETGQTLENCDTKVIEFPVKSPEGRTKFDVSAIEQLEIYKSMMKNYIEMNQSITVTIRDDEWEKAEEWLWNNWNDIVAVSFLPLSTKYYPLMPYEACTKEEYEKRVSEMKPFNPELIQKYEKQETQEDLENDTECSSGACGVR